jgi:hypothetical protein
MAHGRELRIYRRLLVIQAKRRTGERMSKEPRQPHQPPLNMLGCIALLEAIRADGPRSRLSRFPHKNRRAPQHSFVAGLLFIGGLTQEHCLRGRSDSKIAGQGQTNCI